MTMHRIRVLSVLNSSFFGGPQNRNYRLARPLSEMGVDLTVVLPLEEGGCAGMFRDAGIDTVTMPLHRPRETLSARTHADFLLALRREVHSLARLIAERSVDVVLVNGIESPHGALAARMAGAKVVWQLLSTRVPAPVRYALMPLVRGLSDVVMSTGREVARRHPGALSLGERLVTFFPPVDLDEFAPSGREAKRAARIALGVPDDALLFGMVGNLNPQKGHDTFLAAAKLVGEARRDAWFRVIGTEGPTHGNYARKVKARAGELGFWDGSRMAVMRPMSSVAELLGAFDVFVLPSVPRSEGIPTTVLEAMAKGLPVVATDVGGTREAVWDGESGFVVPALQPGAMAEALHRMARDAGSRARFGRVGRELASRHYSVESCARAHADAVNIAMRR